MKFYKTSEIRNITLVGHGGEGKTTLTEAMLFISGAIDRQGKIEDGNTVMDFDPEEIKRHISISSAVAPAQWKGTKINIIDTPGYFDFIGDATSGYYLGDSALILVNGLNGLTVGAEKAWDACVNAGIAKAFFINQMDKENVDFDKAVDSLKQKYGNNITVMQLPIGQGLNFKGVVDIIDMKAYTFDGKKVNETQIPDDLLDKASSIRETIIENAAENDETLMEKYFEGEELSKEDILNGLREGVSTGDVVPIFIGAASPNLGVSLLLDNLVSFMPSPDKVTKIKGKTPKGEEVVYTADASEPFAAQVYKTVADPFVGKLSIFKILGGEISVGQSIKNGNTEKGEKFGQLYVMSGKKLINVDKLSAGDIGALAKLQNTNTGGSLCDESKVVVFPDVVFPEPCISLAVTAKKQGEEEKVFSGLHRLEEEDPSFRMDKSADTPDTLVSGLGELHLEVICKKLQNKFGVEAQLSDPKIPYRETIKKKVQAQGRHKKQSGGHGQYGDVWIEFEPLFGSEESFEFVDKIVGGVVPRQYIPAVEKGLRESLPKGVLAGFPMVNIKATLYDGSYHPVDSSEMAFKIAASLAYKKACGEANPVLLEPIYKVIVTTPDEYMGDIIGDINRRRGRILGMNPVNGNQEVVAEVPLVEVFKYATDLRSMSQARGSFKMTFERYEELPGNLAEKVIEQAKKENEES
ncbi:MAG: elongation factor G [Christensenellales bacterium]|jgi:elongation factor G